MKSCAVDGRGVLADHLAKDIGWLGTQILEMREWHRSASAPRVAAGWSLQFQVGDEYPDGYWETPFMWATREAAEDAENVLRHDPPDVPLYDPYTGAQTPPGRHSEIAQCSPSSSEARVASSPISSYVVHARVAAAAR